MITSELINEHLSAIKSSFASDPGLVSLTLHGQFAKGPVDTYYADIDLIFVFEDEVLQGALAHIERYFASLSNASLNKEYRVIYRAESGPMHPLRSRDTLEFAPLRETPILFFHVSVFPRSFYSRENPSEKRPSLLLMYSWQVLQPILGTPLAQLAQIPKLSFEAVRCEGLGLRDCLDMIQRQIKKYWLWKLKEDGTRSMEWRSSDLEDVELFEMPLYAFRWCATNCARLLRDRIPIRPEISDFDVLLRFVLPKSFHESARKLQATIDQVDELRLRFTDDPDAFWQSYSREVFCQTVEQILASADEWLGHISAFRALDFRLPIDGQVVPIKVCVDSPELIGSTIAGLNADRVFVVADKMLLQLYNPHALLEGRSDGGMPETHSLPFDAQSKSLDGLALVVEEAERVGSTSQSVLVTFGGGNVGNTGGTAAGLICRGTGLIHVPTTLISQLDSAIGAKQSVNGRLGKNYLGLFHAPDLVYVQPLFLLSLGYGQIADGLVEAMKHGMCQNQALVEEVLRYVARKEEAPFDVMLRILESTISLKLQYMRIDPRENDPLTHLELGHKVGHAVEHICQGHVSHGQAVAFGILVESIIFVNMQASSPTTGEYVRECIMPLIIQNPYLKSIDPGIVASQLRHDNKRAGNRLPFSYLEAPQHPKSCKVTLDEDFLASVSRAVNDVKENIQS